MKYLVALFVGIAAALPAHAQPPQRASDLRKALQQYHPAGPLRPRELSPAERAELRRQLSEFRQPVRRKP
jgi:hypothetical protein